MVVVEEEDQGLQPRQRRGGTPDAPAGVGRSSNPPPPWMYVPGCRRTHRKRGGLRIPTDHPRVCHPCGVEGIVYW